MIKKDIHDHLLRRQIQDKIDDAYEARDVHLMKEIAELMAESYILARVSAKYLGQEAARNLGSLPRSESQDRGL